MLLQKNWQEEFAPLLELYVADLPELYYLSIHEVKDVENHWKLQHGARLKFELGCFS